MKLPGPLNRLVGSQGGPTAAFVVATAFVLQAFDIGLWRMAVIGGAALLGFLAELWVDNIRKQHALDNAEGEKLELRQKLEQVEAAAATSFEATGRNEELEDENAQLRAQLHSPRVTLQSVLGSLGQQAAVIELVEAHRQLNAAGLGNLLVVRIEAAEGAAIVSAHVPHDADRLTNQAVTLLDPYGAIVGNGLVIAAGPNQLSASFALTDLVEDFLAVLLEGNNIDPDGYRLTLYGATLTPYLSLTDEQLRELRSALVAGANGIASVFAAPQQRSLLDTQDDQSDGTEQGALNA